MGSHAIQHYYIEGDDLMSWEINTTEWHHIKNVNEKTKEEIQRLIAYIQQLNHMENLERLNVFSLRLRVDDKEVVINDESSWEPGTTYVLSNDGLNVRQADHLQWDDSSEFMRVLATAEESAELSLELQYDAMVLLGKEYGCDYWCDDKSLEEALAGHVERKIIEYYDQDDAIALYHLGVHGAEDLACKEESIKIDDIEDWFAYNFQIVMTKNGAWDDDPENLGALMMLANTFVEKHDFYNEADEPYEDEFEFSESIRLSNEELEDFRSDMQKFADLAEAADADMELTAAFTADGGYPFAAIEFVLEDGKIVEKCCRF